MGGGGLCGFGKSPVEGVETLGEGWGVSQPSASVCPVETWVFPHNWIVFPGVLVPPVQEVALGVW